MQKQARITRGQTTEPDEVRRLLGLRAGDGLLRTVKQTPDTRMSDPIVQALSKWVFRPAQLNNQPVAVKMPLGIPL